MRSFSSVLLAVAALGAASGEKSDDPSQKGSAVTADCLTEFNTARERADLDPFTAEPDENKKVPIDNAEYITAVCKAMLQGTDMGSEKTIIERSGTYAYAPQTGSTADCPAAVTYWKKAYVNLGDLPPEYEGNTGVYEDSRNRSLVALYNPNKGATVDCAYITCPVSPTSTTTVATSAGSTSEEGEEDEDLTEDGAKRLSEEREAAGSASSGDQPKTGPTVRRLSTPSETVTGLVCLTNPAALENGKKPFSEEVWEDIQEAIENSASASTQSALLATGLILFTSSIIL